MNKKNITKSAKDIVRSSLVIITEILIKSKIFIHDTSETCHTHISLNISSLETQVSNSAFAKAMSIN